VGSGLSLGARITSSASMPVRLKAALDRHASGARKPVLIATAPRLRHRLHA
jgi:hypothetical protein